jgi:MFS family permease
MWSFVFMIGMVIQIGSEAGKWYQIVVGRFVAGLGVGGLSILVPLFQGESSPTHIRGAIVCCYQLFITIGILIANIINYGTEVSKTYRLITFLPLLKVISCRVSSRLRPGELSWVLGSCGPSS